MFIITGATGQLGRGIVEELLALIPADQVGVSVRNPEKASDFAARGVRVRQGDFGDAQSLLHAFEGATQLLLVSSNAAATGGDPLVQHRTAIDAARTAGVKRIVYTSQIAASDSSAFPPARDHAATETMLRESGVAWTALRHGFYAASGVMFMGDALKSGVIAAPADGKVNWTTHADLAEADALILASDGMFDGATPPLASSQPLNLADLATIASDLGNPVRRETISDDELRSKMMTRGMPGGVLDIAAGFYFAARTGEFETADTTLETLLRRAPTTMQSVIAAKVSGAS